MIFFVFGPLLSQTAHVGPVSVSYQQVRSHVHGKCVGPELIQPQHRRMLVSLPLNNNYYNN